MTEQLQRLAGVCLLVAVRLKDRGVLVDEIADIQVAAILEVVLGKDLRCSAISQDDGIARQRARNCGCSMHPRTRFGTSVSKFQSKKASKPKFQSLLCFSQRGAETASVQQQHLCRWPVLQGLVAAAAAATAVAATAGTIATTAVATAGTIATTVAATAAAEAAGAWRTCLHRTGFIHSDAAAAK